ncbi:hypothetical protein R1sor_011879 [Riccia sorocarpa]|uniref:Uncharacterized protein n=1 Tax=Riccia sorocarpa TaxID=122646 RepID=A0ABD3I285_9MARC
MIGCSKKEEKKLEGVCRAFLWGVTEEGKPKKPLIAWKRLTRAKLQGGVGLLSFNCRALALQMRHLTGILEGSTAEWAMIVRRMLRVKMLTGTQVGEKSKWEGEDVLFLLDTLRIQEAPTVDKLLRVWFTFKKFLSFSETSDIPASLPIGSLKRLRAMMGNNDSTGFQLLELEARRNQILILSDTVDPQGEMTIQWRECIDRVTETFQNKVWRMGEWLIDLSTSDDRLTLNGGWCWSDGHEVNLKWSRPAKDTHMKVCWTERNKFLFKGKRLLQSPRSMLNTVQVHFRSQAGRVPEEKRRQFQEDFQDFFVHATAVWKEQVSRQAAVNRILQEAGTEELDNSTDLNEVFTGSDRASSTSEKSSDGESECTAPTQGSLVDGIAD